MSIEQSPLPENSHSGAAELPPTPPVADTAIPNPLPPTPSKDKKILAGVMAIIFGGLGVHKFILGYNKEGGIQLAAGLLLMVLSCGSLFFISAIIGLVEGIIYLTKTDEEFAQTYLIGRRPWF